MPYKENGKSRLNSLPPDFLLAFGNILLLWVFTFPLENEILRALFLAISLFFLPGHFVYPLVLEKERPSLEKLLLSICLSICLSIVGFSLANFIFGVKSSYGYLFAVSTGVVLVSGAVSKFIQVQTREKKK